ncbi:MAG: phospholipase D family protein [Planctomycetaceae bacterium]
MLELNSRRLLLESFAPPPGYHLNWTIGTTYTLDLTALLAAPVAFAFANCQDEDGRPLLEPLALLKAVRQHAHRMCLFCQAGRIHVPRRYQPLLASLEGSVVEAVAPRGGSFHPKVWFLRYENDDAEVFYRFLCLSRNMTFDRCWDTMLCLEGDLMERTNAYSRNHPLGQFVEALPGMAVRKLSKPWSQRIAQLADEVRKVDFQPPDGFTEVGFHPVGIEGGRASRDWPFPDQVKRMLVVSPFVSDSRLSDLAEVSDSIELISRMDQLERLQPATLNTFANTWVLDNAAEPEPDDAEHSEAASSPPDEESGSEAASTSAAEHDAPLSGLHAKVYVVDHGWDASVFVGSANATNAAFAENVEFLTQLDGKRSYCGVEAVLGTRPDDGTATPKSVVCLADLLQRFRPDEHAVPADQQTQEFERLVDRVATSIAKALPEAVCQTAMEPDSFTMTLRQTKKWKPPTGRDFQLTVRPASLSVAATRQIVPGDPEWAVFGPLSMLSLTSFFVFEVSSTAPKLARQFLLNIPLSNEPADRKECLLRSLLSDPDRVLQFMLLLLSDADAGDFATLFDIDPAGDAKRAFGGLLKGATLFESLLRALDKNPGCLQQVADTIADLSRTDDGLRLLPHDLKEIWDPIWAVAQQNQQRSGAGGAQR